MKPMGSASVSAWFEVGAGGWGWVRTKQCHRPHSVDWWWGDPRIVGGEGVFRRLHFTLNFFLQIVHFVFQSSTLVLNF